MDLTKLVMDKEGNYDKQYLELESKKILMGLYGVDFDAEHNEFSSIIKLFKKLTGRYIEPKLLAKKEIAEILINNKLVNNLEEGLIETDRLLEEGIQLGKREDYGAGAEFVEYISRNGSIKYRLEYYPMADFNL